MTKLRNNASIFLILALVLTSLSPAWAFDLKVEPVRASYRGGESVTVSADVYGAGGGFSWFLTDWESRTAALDGEEKSITFSLPENNTGAMAIAVVEAVYGGERGSIDIAVEPAEAPFAALAEEGPLRITDLCPANGATDVSVNTAVYIRFNKPANIVKAMPVFNGHIGIAGQQYSLQPNEDRTLWSLAPGSIVLAPKTTYTVSSFMKITDPETGAVLYNFPAPAFPAWQFTTAEEGPSGIEITDCPRRLQVGQSYPLKAVVKDKKGNVLDWPVDWEVVSMNGGGATVDAAGNLTGTVPGYLRLVARARDYPAVCDDNEFDNHVEIRRNFDRHLLEVWVTELREKYNSPPLVGADGTIYLTTGGGNPVTRAYDSAGNKLEGFQEIDGWVAVLARIGGREYLLGIKDRKICAYDPVTGRLEWQSQAVSSGLGNICVDTEGNIYASSMNDGKVYAFSLDSDRYLWSYFAEINVYSKLTVGPDNLLYVVGGDNKVFCLDSRGSLRWQYTTPTLTQNCNIPAGVEVDSAGNVYFLENVDPYNGDEFNIYSLNPGGGLRWSKNKQNSALKNLFVDEDDTLYVTITDLSNKTEKLTRLNRENGEVEKEFGVYGCDRFMRSNDGYIYTNKFIFNDNLEVVGYADLEAVGYADDYYRDLPYMSYSKLALCPDGALVRVVISSDKAVALEKVTLVDSAGAVPSAVEVGESEITLIQGGTRDIFAKVKDSRGYLLPFQALIYQTGDPAVAAVDQAGRITAVGAGDTVITVKVKDHENVSAAVSLHVLPPGEVTDIYFVPQHGGSHGGVDLEERITSVNGVVWEEMVVQLVVRDQHGNVLQGLPVKWTLSDSSVVQMYNYAGGAMGGVSKSIAVLNGLKEGTAVLQAELDGYVGFSAQLAVQIGPAPYEILWTLPIEGDWDDKIAYHTQAADGTLFIANKRKLKAVSSAGAVLWEQNISDKYGFMPAIPVVDDSNVYVYDISGLNLSLTALNRRDGSLRWSFAGGLGSVEQIRAGAGGVYLLSDGGKLYGLDRDSGSPLWQSPLSLGGGAVTLGLSAGGELYYARGRQVFRVPGDGSAGLLYTAEEGAALVIEEITAAGDIIMEKSAGGSYSIISVGPEGTKNWEKPVKTAVELSSAGGVIYAVTREKSNPTVYFIKEDGTVQAERALTTPSTTETIHSDSRTRPLAGSDGIVYIPLNCLYAVNAADGRQLWTAEFKDGFFKRSPKSATLDENNVLYLACDDYGFVAIKSKEAGVADESGFYIDISGIGSLRGNTYRNLTFRVKNNNNTAGEIRVVVALEETRGGSVLSYAAAADRLDAGAVKSYNFGVHIPGAGNFRISIKLLDQSNQVLTGKMLPVS
ncbi:MAG: PQQ-binding-like beta-propeller repeat protein [Peptococcaceae bacterium]|nr:PQQ-binding-like beta-propeller repeat protein [Peptococcaceae bacterium]